jgi:hypothetical protein
MTEGSANFASLRGVVVEVEGFVRDDGWDQPGRLFALVSTAELLETQPHLAAELGASHSAAPSEITPVEQEVDHSRRSLEELLEMIAWPPAVVGALAVVERVVLPPEAEDDVPDDPDEADRYAAAHPQREDVRVAAGVLRSGESHCVIRLRSHDSDDYLLHGADLAPGLVGALRETLEADGEGADRDEEQADEHPTDEAGRRGAGST